jgi:putative IMPACT (imprinted ancient) family translation regulator
VLLNTDYNGIGKVLYLLGQYGLEPADSDYGVDVTLQLQIADEQAERLKKELTEATSGKIGWEVLDELYFVQKENKK